MLKITVTVDLDMRRNIDHHLRRQPFLFGPRAGVPSKQHPQGFRRAMHCDNLAGAGGSDRKKNNQSMIIYRPFAGKDHVV